MGALCLSKWPRVVRLREVSIVTASPNRVAAILEALPDGIVADCISLHALPRRPPKSSVIIDIDLERPCEVQTIRQFLLLHPSPRQVIVCLNQVGSYLQQTQARAIGATDTLQKPISSRLLQQLLLPQGLRIEGEAAPALAAANEIAAFHDLLTSARNGGPVNLELAFRAGAAIADKLGSVGLTKYLSTIRDHHSRTYVHCLTVTAVATAFGIELGFNRDDTERIAVAGLLHDIGKSRIELDILEKPGPLDDSEEQIMRSHPQLGHDLMKNTPNMSSDTLDMILHHHEYLDGSGYPHGLQGSQISDLNRIITIADIFGAMIEARSYKPARSGLEALGILHRMGPKLDRALVRAFEPLAMQYFGLTGLPREARLRA